MYDEWLARDEDGSRSFEALCGRTAEWREVRNSVSVSRSNRNVKASRFVVSVRVGTFKRGPMTVGSFVKVRAVRRKGDRNEIKKSYLLFENIENKNKTGMKTPKIDRIKISLAASQIWKNPCLPAWERI